MKTILEFSLPEEKEDLKCAQKGMDAHIAITDFYNDSIRRRLKYEELSDNDTKLIEKIRDEFIQIMNEHEIEF